MHKNTLQHFEREASAPLPMPAGGNGSYLADGESAVRTEVARLMRLESGFADLLAGWRTSTESQQWNEFHLETLAYRVDPRHR